MSVTEQKLRKVKDLAAGDGLIDVACFQFINIDSIKKAIGSSWPDMRTKIFSAGETFLEHRLSPSDIIIQSHDGFLVIFEKLSHSDAEDAAEDLSTGMLAFFLGDEYLKKIKLSYSYKSVLADKIEQLARHPKKDGHNPKENNISAPLVHALPKIPQKIPTEITLSYYPIWHSVSSQITCYTLLPQRIINGIQYIGIDAIPKDTPLGFRKNLDLQVLIKAQEDLINLLSCHNKSVVSITVSYSIFNDPEALAHYMRQLKELPDIYSKFILICVDEIPKGTPEFVLIQNLNILKNSCGSLLIHNLDLSFNPVQFKACGISLFGFNLTKFLKGNGLQEAELLKISKFCEEAKINNFDVYFTNVQHRRQILTLKQAGVQYFSGNSVGGEVMKLPELKCLTPKEIFQRQ